MRRNRYAWFVERISPNWYRAELWLNPYVGFMLAATKPAMTPRQARADARKAFRGYPAYDTSAPTARQMQEFKP